MKHPLYYKSPEKIERYKKEVLKKGADIAKRLSDLLAGKASNVTLSDFLLEEDPDSLQNPIKRLRKYLKHINKIIKKFDDESYGICEVCHKPIPEGELENMPWADICLSCFKKGNQ